MYIQSLSVRYEQLYRSEKKILEEKRHELGNLKNKIKKVKWTRNIKIKCLNLLSFTHLTGRVLHAMERKVLVKGSFVQTVALGPSWVQPQLICGTRLVWA